MVEKALPETIECTLYEHSIVMTETADLSGLPEKEFLLPADGVHDFELEAGCLQPGMTDKGRYPIR